MKFFIFLVCLITVNISKAQIRFIDIDSKLVIPSLNIYHESGKLIGLTDKNGAVQFLEGVEANRLPPMTIIAQHISYTPKNIEIKSLNEEQVYELTPRSIVIDDVVVIAKPKEVIVLKGYYRSLETFNHQHKYFSDGVVEFYIPLIKGKPKPKYRLIDYRIFTDATITADYTEKMGPFFQIPRVPEMNGQNLSDRLADMGQKNDGTNRVRLIKNGDDVGYLTKSNDGNNLQLYIDKVLPDSVIKEKLFRIEARTLQEVSLENYSSISMDPITPFNLTSIYQNIVGTIKRKSEYGHIPYEGLNEFYVMEKRYMSWDEYKSIQKDLTKSIYKTPEKSDYKNRFWEDLDKYHIPAINGALGIQLEQNLKLIN